MKLARRGLLLVALLILAVWTIPRQTLAREPEIFAPGGIALQGYDPVAYVTLGKAVKGSAAYALVWRGATWYFASAETMTAFEMNPQAFAPQYGGYCAYAMTMGSMVPTAPEAFAVEGGRLFLTHSLEIRAIWEKDIAGNVALADANWQAQLTKK